MSHIYRRVNQSNGETFTHQKEVTGEGANQLAAFVEGLAYMEGPEAEAEMTNEGETKTFSQAVFVVHGRDEGLREKVARVLDRLGFEPLILMEEPNRGPTYAGEILVNAALVLRAFAPP